MQQSNINYPKLLKLTKIGGLLGLDNFYLKKSLSGTIKIFLILFGMVATIVIAIYIATTIKESLQTAEELGRAASIKGPISEDTAKGINTSTALKSAEYYVFAYNYAKNWILAKYLVAFIFLGLGIGAIVTSLIWWISCIVLTHKGLATRLNGWKSFKNWFTTHQVVVQNVKK